MNRLGKGRGRESVREAKIFQTLAINAICKIFFAVSIFFPHLTLFSWKTIKNSKLSIDVFMTNKTFFSQHNSFGVSHHIRVSKNGLKSRHGMVKRTSSDFLKGGYPVDLLITLWTAHGCGDMWRCKNGKDFVSNTLKGRAQASRQNAAFVLVKWCVTTMGLLSQPLMVRKWAAVIATLKRSLQANWSSTQVEKEQMWSPNIALSKWMERLDFSKSRSVALWWCQRNSWMIGMRTLKAYRASAFRDTFCDMSRTGEMLQMCLG